MCPGVIRRAVEQLVAKRDERKAALAAAAEQHPTDLPRRAAAFVVATLSPEIGFDEALALFDDHVTRKEVADGLRDQE